MRCYGNGEGENTQGWGSRPWATFSAEETCEQRLDNCAKPQCTGLNGRDRIGEHRPWMLSHGTKGPSSGNPAFSDHGGLTLIFRRWVCVSDSSSKARPRILGRPEINSQHLMQCPAEGRYARYTLASVIFRNITFSLHTVKIIEKFRGKD